MLGDPRAKAKVAAFYHRWLQLDRLHDLAKDPKSYPGFDAGIVSDLRTSLDLFLEDVTWGEKSDWRQLMLADTVHLNGRLAKFYGVELPADAPFQKVKMDPKKHAGLLTHPLLMAGFSYASVSSPIHRGVFLARALLGRRLRAPPDAVTPIPPELHPSLSTRERILLQTKGPDCQSCHAMINPLGFALENFDAVGRFPRNREGETRQRAGLLLDDRRRGREVQRRPRAGRVPRAERGGPRGLRRAPLPLPGQAADPGPRAEPPRRPPRRIREGRLRRPEASDSGSRRRGAPGRCKEGRREENAMMDRRDFLRNLGLGAGALPFLNLPSLQAAPRKASRKQRLVVMFSPDGVVPWNFWPDQEGDAFTLKESLTPLAPFQKRCWRCTASTTGSRATATATCAASAAC
jgi:hypothetical protein